MILKILIAILLLQQTLAQRKKCQPTEYSFSNLALTWPKEFCHNSGKCQAGWERIWDKKSFTIHGYWPSSLNPAYLACQKQNKFKNGEQCDPYCCQKYSFNQSKFSDAEQLNLNLNWPDLKELDSNNSFHKYEWDKHGTCYMFLQHNGTQPTKLTNDQIFREYMLGTVAKKVALNITLQSGDSYENEEKLAQRIGIPKEVFLPICNSYKNLGQFLSEIRICYTLATPGQEQMRNCPEKQPGNVCSSKRPINIR